MDLSDTYPLLIKVVVICIFFPILLVGVVGNLMVIATVVRNRRMHTATHVFISELAVADLLILSFCMPFTITSLYITGEWVFGTHVCKMVKFIQSTGVITSIMTQVAMSIERYFVLVYPMRARMFWTKSVALKMGCVILLVSGLVALRRPLSGGTVEVPTDPNNGREVNNPDKHNGTVYDVKLLCKDIPGDAAVYYNSFRVVCLYVTPVAVIGILYGKIAKHLAMTTTGHVLSNSNDKVSRDRKRVVRMLIAMVTVFAVCWLPANITFLMGALPDAQQYTRNARWVPWFTFVKGLLVYFSCISNPILYTFMSSQYRQAFQRMLCVCRANLDNKRADESESKITKSDVVSLSQALEMK